MRTAAALIALLTLAGGAGAYDAPMYARLLFMPGDREIIRQHFITFPGERPVALDSRPGITPGVERQRRLPPGLFWRRFPPALAARMRPLPDGYYRAIVDNDALIVADATGVIFDILEDVF
jgi:hypothetical protein